MDIPQDQIPGAKWRSWTAPFLACYGASPGNVLEIGIGHYSTPAIHSLVVAGGFSVTSLEDDKDWMAGFQKTYGIPGAHEFLLGHYSLSIPFVVQDAIDEKVRYSVALIDQGGACQGRADAFKALLPICDFLVVHDYWGDNKTLIDPMLGGLNWKVTSTYIPPTLVASKVKSVPSSIV